MLLTEYLRDHPVKVKLLKIATGGGCENCGNAFPLALLEIHVIGSPPDCGGEQNDLQKHLLVLCSDCRRSFRSGQIADSLQHELVRHRPVGIRRAMRELMNYHPRRYSPPDDIDLAAVFRDVFESRMLDLCLNGG